MPAIAAVASANVMINDIKNVAIVNAGMSDEASARTITIDPDNYGASSLCSAINGQGVSVELVRGDDFLRNRIADEEAITFVKIDVEGHEVSALAGLRETIAKHLPIIWFEAHSRAEIDQIADVLGHDRYAFLYSFGDPVERLGDTFRGALRRVTRGIRIGLRPVDAKLDGRYLNMIASPSPLLGDIFPKHS